MATTDARDPDRDMVKERPLSSLCCERNPEPSHQRQQIIDLIAAGADASIRNKAGKTPIDYARDEETRALLLGLQS